MRTLVLLGLLTLIASQALATHPYEDIVAYWNFDEQVLDQTSNNLDGTIQGSAAYSTTIPDLQFNNTDSLTLDASDDYVTVTDNDLLSFGDGSADSPFSVTAWVYMEDATRFAIAVKSDASTNKEWFIRTFTSDELQVRFWDESAGTHITLQSDNALTAYENQWTHIAFTYDATEASSGITLYVNGVQIAASSADFGSYTAMENLGHTLDIGADAATFFSDGFIDDVRIYDVELTADQVLFIASENPATIIEDNFDSLGSGADLNGRTPSPTNTPGNTWSGNTTFDGASSCPDSSTRCINVTTNGQFITIDSEYVDHAVYVDYEQDVVSGSADNRMSVVVRDDGTEADYLQCNIRGGATDVYVLREAIASSGSDIASASFNPGAGTTYEFGCVARGQALVGLIDDVFTISANLAAAPENDETHVGLNSNAFVNSNMRWDNFRVETVPVIDVSNLHKQTIIHDDFAGTSGDIASTEPDTVSQGTTWSTSAANDCSQNGSGSLVFSAGGDACRIDTNISFDTETEGQAYGIEMRWHAQSNNNNFTLHARTEHPYDANRDWISYNKDYVLNTINIVTWINNTQYGVGTATDTSSNSTAHDYELILDRDGRIDIYVDGELGSRGWSNANRSLDGCGVNHGASYVSSGGQAEFLKCYRYIDRRHRLVRAGN